MPTAKVMVESEIVTSPTLKPKKAVRTEVSTSTEWRPQGASASRTATSTSATRAKPVASTAIWLIERLRSPVLACNAVATRVCSVREPPMKVSALEISR